MAVFYADVLWEPFYNDYIDTMQKGAIQKIVDWNSQKCRGGSIFGAKNTQAYCFEQIKKRIM